MSIHIKYASKDDVDRVGLLFVEILDTLHYYNDTAKKNEKSKYTSEELIKKIQEDMYSVMSVYEDDNIVGFCFSRFDDYTVWLEWFGIADSHRGRGIGDLILMELEVATKKRGCHKIWCDSRTKNLASFKVLQRNSYTIVATLENHWYGQDFFIWQKFLGVE